MEGRSGPSRPFPPGGVPIHHRTLTVSAACLALGLTACGGSSKPLSQADYVKQASAICQDVQAKGKKLAQPTSLAEIGTFTDKAKPLLQDEVKRLRALKAPEKIKAQADAAYDLLDQQLGRLDDIKAAVAKKDQKAAAQVATETGRSSADFAAKVKAIGLADCGGSV